MNPYALFITFIAGFLVGVFVMTVPVIYDAYFLPV